MTSIYVEFMDAKKKKSRHVASIKSSPRVNPATCNVATVFTATWQTAINFKRRPPRRKIGRHKIGPLKVNNNPRERSRQLRPAECRRGLTSRTLARITLLLSMLFIFPSLLDCSPDINPRTPSGKNDERIPIEIHALEKALYIRVCTCVCVPVCATAKANWIHRLTASEWQHKGTANLARYLAKPRMLNPSPACHPLGTLVVDSEDQKTRG